MATTTTTRYCYDAFGRRVAKSSEVQKASKINQRGKLVRFPDSLLHLRVDEKANRQTMLMLWAVFVKVVVTHIRIKPLKS